MTGPDFSTSENLSPDQSEEILTGELGSLRQGLDAHQESFFTALDELLTHPMREAFSTAYEAHAQLMDRAGLGHGEGGPGEERKAGARSGEEAEISNGTRFRHYREGVRSEVLQPLRAALQEIEIGRFVADRWEGFQNSLPSLADPALLVGRETELKWISGRLDAWQTGSGAPCVHAGPPGVGQTSFLNALNADLLKEFKVFRVELDQRYQSENALVARLAKELEISGDGSWTFERLATHLSPATPQAQRMAIQVEHLEHLLLRTPGGTALLGDFLSFQASTHGHAFWISTASSATWKLVEKSDPTAAGLTAHQTFSTFSRVAIEDLIMVRHQRSGLPVEFRQPRDLNPLVRRKLRLSRGEKAKQEILRTEFFDRLYRMSAGSAGAAILLWLRALNFSSKKGWLRVTPPRPIRFTFMEELDPNLDFVLMALMEHRSLTLEELAAVFDVSREQAFRTFEALRRRMLVEPLGTRRSAEPCLESVEDGVRYRIPGILSHVVVARLRNRNILH